MGSVNMRTVMSMSLMDNAGVYGSKRLPSSLHSHVSWLQYSAYSANPAGLKSARRLPSALCTAVPLSGSPYCLARLASECDVRNGSSMRPWARVSIHSLGLMPQCCVRMNPSNRVLWHRTAELAQSKLLCSQSMVSESEPLNHCAGSSFLITDTPMISNRSSLMYASVCILDSE